MKKFILSSFAAMALSSVSGAAVITCSPANGNPNVIENNVPVTSPKLYNCAAYTAPSGNLITGIAVRLAASFNDEVVDGSNSTLSATGTSSLGPSQSVVTTAGDNIGATNPFFQTGGNTAVANLASLGASTVNVTWSVSGPAVQNGTVVVALITTETSTVPEPSTFMMLGTALTALGVIARRRKA